MSVVAQAETRKTERNRDISVDIYWRMVRSKNERRGVNLRIKRKRGKNQRYGIRNKKISVK